MIANGDVYTREDAENLVLFLSIMFLSYDSFCKMSCSCQMQNSGCSGVMIARPLLLNASVLIRQPAPTGNVISDLHPDSANSMSAGCPPHPSGASAGWKTLREVICDFLTEWYVFLDIILTFF